MTNWAEARRRRQAARRPARRQEDNEARSWLERNRNEYAFAANHFGETRYAIEFVDELYNAGAQLVIVADIFDEPERIEEEGGPFAATMYVTIPNSADVALSVMSVVAQQAPQEVDVRDPPGRRGGRGLTVRLWWD